MGDVTSVIKIPANKTPIAGVAQRIPWVGILLIKTFIAEKDNTKPNNMVAADIRYKGIVIIRFTLNIESMI